MSDKPNIAIIAVGSGATTAMIDLIPKMPDARFSAYPNLNNLLKLNSNTSPDITKYQNRYRAHLKYKIYPCSDSPTIEKTQARIFLGRNSWGANVSETMMKYGTGKHVVPVQAGVD